MKPRFHLGFKTFTFWKKTLRCSFYLSAMAEAEVTARSPSRDGLEMESGLVLGGQDEKNRTRGDLKANAHPNTDFLKIISHLGSHLLVLIK